MNQLFLDDIAPDYGTIKAVKVFDQTTGEPEPMSVKEALARVQKSGEKMIVLDSRGKCYLYRLGMKRIRSNAKMAEDLKRIMG